MDFYCLNTKIKVRKMSREKISCFGDRWEVAEVRLVAFVCISHFLRFSSMLAPTAKLLPQISNGCLGLGAGLL